MKYGTQTRLKYLLPYLKDRGRLYDPSRKADMRLKWMDYIAKGNSIRKASRHFDHPESTIRYWYKRYDPSNLQSLEDKSKKPKKTRQCIVPWHLQQEVKKLRKKYPSWGKAKLQKELGKGGIQIGQSRIQKIINTAGLKRFRTKKRNVKRTNRRHMYSVPRRVCKIVCVNG